MEIYDNQPIDIRLDMYRDMPINQLFDNITYATITTGVRPNFDLPFLTIDDHSQLNKKDNSSKNF